MLILYFLIVIYHFHNYPLYRGRVSCQPWPSGRSRVAIWPSSVDTRRANGLIIVPSIYDGKIQWSTSGIENVADFCHMTQLGHILSIHEPP